MMDIKRIQELTKDVERLQKRQARKIEKHAEEMELLQLEIDDKIDEIACQMPTTN